MNKIDIVKCQAFSGASSQTVAINLENFLFAEKDNIESVIRYDSHVTPTTERNSFRDGVVYTIFLFYKAKN